MELDAMIFIFWMLSFKPAFSLSSFTFIKRLFSSSLPSAIRVMSSVYLRLLLYSGDWHSGEMVDSCPKPNFKDSDWMKVKKGELLREELRVCYLPSCADFLRIGWWWGNRVVLQESGVQPEAALFYVGGGFNSCRRIQRLLCPFPEVEWGPWPEAALLFLDCSFFVSAFSPFHDKQLFEAALRNSGLPWWLRG